MLMGRIGDALGVISSARSHKTPPDIMGGELCDEVERAAELE
jgi:hypothetical protein